VLLPGAIDAQGHDETVLGEHDAIDEDRDQRSSTLSDALCQAATCAPVFATSRRLRLLLLVPRLRIPAGSGSRLRVSARRDPQQQLFDNAPVERVGLSHGLERGQRHLPLLGADPRAPIWTLRPPSTTVLAAVPARAASRAS
jgi:hypothetical protein